MSELQLVKSVDHGKQGKHDHWYTFSCPHCDIQVERESTNERQCCKGCLEWFKWKGPTPPAEELAIGETNPVRGIRQRDGTVKVPSIKTFPADSEGVDLIKLTQLAAEYHYNYQLKAGEKNIIRDAVTKLRSYRAEITRLRAALDDKVLATEDYEAADLGMLRAYNRDLMSTGSLGRAQQIQECIAELIHHRAVAAAMGAHSAMLCNECGKAYLPSEGCLRCAVAELVAGLERAHEEMSEAWSDSNGGGPACDPEEVTRVSDLIIKHSPPEQAKEHSLAGPEFTHTRKPDDQVPQFDDGEQASGEGAG
jgi:hypothetical protein